MNSLVTKKLILTGLLGVLFFTLKYIKVLLELPTSQNEIVDDQCTLYMTTSAIRGTGRGVFAGKDFQNGEKLIPVSSVVHMRLEHVSSTQIINYVYDAEVDYATFNFGVANICNHLQSAKRAQQSSIKSKIKGLDMRTEAYDQHMGADMTTTVPISAGSEIYVNYGEDWFEDRGIDEIFDLPVNTIPLAELRQGEAQCLSHLYVEQSHIPMAGKGVFSKVSYKTGDTVYISPVAILPKQLVRKNEDTNVLINYCISTEGSDAALLPIALTGLLNHGGRMKSNIRMEWYTSEGEVSRLDLPIKDLEAMPFAPLDIRYVATRHIPKGEELLLDYGDVWALKWGEHLDRLIEWNGDTEWSADTIDNLEKPSVTVMPQFREAIGVPTGFFPAHFLSDCIGSEEACADNIAPSEKKKQINHLYEMSKLAMRDIMEG